MSDLAPMTRIEMCEPCTEGDVSWLSRDEIYNAIKSLSLADKTKIMRIAAIYERVTIPYADYEDLFAEARWRILDGRRRWPRDLPAVAFFRGVIRSIASEWKSKHVLMDQKIEEVAGEAVEGGQPRKDESPSPGFSVPPGGWAGERAILDRNYIAEIVKAYDDDPIVHILAGLSGEQLRKMSGLGKTEYENKLRKIRRRGEKIWVERKK
jgi:hypothetical protein